METNIDNNWLTFKVKRFCISLQSGNRSYIYLTISHQIFRLSRDHEVLWFVKFKRTILKYVTFLTLWVTGVKLDRKICTLRWNTGYEAETYDVVIVISQTPQADPEARAQPSFKNLYTLKFRCLFVASSVISVASLLKAAATLVLASAMMMVRSDASTYGKWKLEVINLWLEIPKLLIISSRMWNIGYNLHFLWSTIYLTFGWTSTLVVSPFFREINFRAKC